MNVFVCGVVQLINQNELKDEDGPHYVELVGGLKHTTLHDVAKNHNFVEED